jgi:hypothetical protein
MHEASAKAPSGAAIFANERYIGMEGIGQWILWSKICNSVSFLALSTLSEALYTPLQSYPITDSMSSLDFPSQPQPYGPMGDIYHCTLNHLLVTAN